MDQAWKFHSVLDTKFPEEGHVPTLHDCVAEDLHVEDGKLIFDFPGGFRLLPQDEKNPYNQVCGTSASRVSMELFSHSPEDDLTICLLKRHRFFSGFGFTAAKEINVNTLIKKIHSKKWKLEFLCKYTQSLSAMYHCIIYTKRSHMDCWIEIDYTRIDYYWNEVLEEKLE
ncbi:MAG: hypothetical protein SPI09_03940 [Candidatus Limivicinus sp.]|nr:hypothetical protein [Clostridiales bacterium]MDY4486473.1 hypothetical protein [Candidatus Limivicinus sp.]MDY6132496.1 hypothetical protein [Candidatus Limivicinus sp.]